MKFNALFILAFLIIAGKSHADNIIRTSAPIYFKAIVHEDEEDSSSEPTLSLMQHVLPNAMQGQAYAFDFTGLVRWSGLAPEASPPALSWSVANMLPVGLTLDNQGQLTGTPANVEMTAFEILAMHANGEGRQLYTLKVGESVLTASQLALGEKHTCALLMDTTVKCWGENGYGQLGDGTMSRRLTPVSVSGLSGVQQLGLGYDHTCAVMADTTVKCWGRNEYAESPHG